MGPLRSLWLLLALAACSAPRPAILPPEAPPAASHYVSFATADELAAYLRHSHPGGPTVSAHRGGHSGDYPENALVTFEQALRYAPALLEMDVHLTRDSILVLLHDESLDRTTTGAGPLSAVTLAEVRPLRLRDDAGRPTDAAVPTLAEALAWAEGRAIYTIDVKRDVPPAVLVRAIRRAEAENRVVVITYSPETLAEYLRLAPDLSYSVTTTTPEELDAILAVPGVRPERLIAFLGVGRAAPEVIERLHALDIRAMAGVFGDNEARLRQGDRALLEALRAQGVDVIATGAIEAATR